MAFLQHASGYITLHAVPIISMFDLAAFIIDKAASRRPFHVPSCCGTRLAAVAAASMSADCLMFDLHEPNRRMMPWSLQWSRVDGLHFSLPGLLCAYRVLCAIIICNVLLNLHYNTRCSFLLDLHVDRPSPSSGDWKLIYLWWSFLNSACANSAAKPPE